MWDICQKAMNDRTVVLYGTGNETRDFIHAKDLAKCIHIIAEKGSFNADIYPVANGVEVSIQELAQRLVHALGGNSLVRFNGIIRLGDPLRWKADNSRIRTLGYSPAISLQKGLEDYTQWIKQEPKSKS
jgi:nucleoside-diphosphate-sugar epimerase